jgi:hypothetical protein
MGLFGGILQGLGGIFGAVLGAHSNAKAIGKATNAQIAGIDKAIGEQQREYDTSRADFAPYMGIGTSALGPFGDLLGLNGNDAAAKAIESLKSSPIYQSLYGNGLETVLQNASATGGIRGGNTEGALAEFGRDTLADTMQRQIGNLMGAINVGQGATGSVTNVGQHTADQISSGDTSIGNAHFNAILGKQQVYNNLGDQIAKIIASIPTGGF